MIENEFTAVLENWPVEGAGGLDDDGAAARTVDGEEIFFLVPEAAPDTVYCRAPVGSLAGCDEDVAAIAMLEGNYFWQGTAGATLSVKDDTVYLTDRRDARTLSTPEALAGFAAVFADHVKVWRRRLDNCRRGESGKEVR